MSLGRTRKKMAQRQRRGAAVVEFAFVAPLMILLTLGMLELGRMVMVKQIMVNASREGARDAVLPGATSESVQASVEAELAAASISGATITITPSVLSSAAEGTAVTILISVPAADISWIPKPLYSLQNTIEASTTMRKEAS
ncbi:MAG: pilus assembly protein [Planctomycetales bacterium]|nr:pilus assembly protein [Planctomycetales bacterium]